MKNWRSTSRFSRKFQNHRLVLKLLIKEHSGTRNLILESDKKMDQGCTLRVYTSILPQMSILALAPETAYLAVSKYQKLSFNNENSFRLHIEGPQVDLWKNVNFSPCAWNCIFGEGGFKYQELSFDYETSFRWRIEGLQVDFWKVSIFSPEPVIANLGVIRY